MHHAGLGGSIRADIIPEAYDIAVGVEHAVVEEGLWFHVEIGVGGQGRLQHIQFVAAVLFDVLYAIVGAIQLQTNLSGN